MKLKKLLAAVTAAALAVTTMAITSFTASAAATDLLATQVDGAKSVKFTYDFEASSEVAWENCEVIVNTWDNAQSAGDYIKIGFGGSNQEQYYTGDNKYVTITSTSTDQTFLLNLTKNPDGNFQVTLQNSDSYTMIIKKIEALGENGTALYTWNNPDLDTTKYTWQNIPLGSYEGSRMDLAGTFDTSKIVGSGAGIEISYTITSGSESYGLNLYDTASLDANDWDTKVKTVNGSTTGTTFIKFSDISLPSKLSINGWGIDEITGVRVKNGGGNVFTASSITTPGGDEETPAVILAKSEETVKAGASKDIALTIANAEGYAFTAASNAEDKATVTLAEDNSKITVTGVAEGSVTITVTGAKTGEEDITATCAVTVTAADSEEPGGDDEPGTDTPSDRTYVLIWEGSQAIPTWSENLQLSADKFSGAKAGDILTITIIPDTGAQISLKSQSEGWPGLPGFVAASGGNDWYDTSATTYTLTLTEADITAIASGMVVGGQKFTVTKVELNVNKKPGGGDVEHTHTPATEWSKDGTNHWHTCTGCDEKLDLAAHTYANGTCLVCGAADPNAGSTPNPPAPSIPSASSTSTGSSNSPVPVTSTTIVDTILATPDGGRNSVTLGSSTKLDRLVMDALSTKGDVTVKFTVAGGAYWEINGNNITEAKAVDLGVKVNSTLIPESKVNEFAGDKTTVQLTLRHNGDFGFTGTLNVPVGKANNGKFANLYYYHGGKFDFVGSSAISGGMTKFAFSHASNYLIVIDDYAYGEDVSSAAGMNETTTSAVPYAAAVVIIAAFGTSAIVLKKRLSK